MAINPATVAAIGQMGGSVLGSILGGDGDEERRRALELLANVDEQTGEVAPDMRRASTSAVDILRDLYAEGGLDPQARAALGEAHSANAARERMSRGAITQGAQMRGLGGSGVDIAAQLANQQSAANRNATTGAAVAGDARSRAIQSLMGSAGIAGNVRGQDSALSQFNASQRLRKAGMMAGVETDNAAAADKKGDDARFDFGQLGGFLGAGLSGLSSKKQDEDEGPELLNSWGPNAG